MSQDFLNLQERYARLCGLLAPYTPRYPSQDAIQTRRSDDGSPHIELVSGKYNYVVTERGSEYERRVAQTEDELMYWLMDDLTTGIALQIELENRIPGEDSRRQWFSKSVELLARLSPEWAARKQAEYMQILRRHPYRDEA